MKKKGKCVWRVVCHVSWNWTRTGRSHNSQHNSRAHADFEFRCMGSSLCFSDSHILHYYTNSRHHRRRLIEWLIEENSSSNQVRWSVPAGRRVTKLNAAATVFTLGWNLSRMPRTAVLVFSWLVVPICSSSSEIAFFCRGGCARHKRLSVTASRGSATIYSIISNGNQDKSCWREYLTLCTIHEYAWSGLTIIW